MGFLSGSPVTFALAVPAARFCQKELSNDAFVLFEPNIADSDLQGKRGGPVEISTRPGTGRGKTLSFTGRVDYVLSAGKCEFLGCMNRAQGLTFN